MKNIHDIRRDNLRELIAERFEGSQTKFATAAGIRQPSFVSRLLSEREPTQKNMGSQLARAIETALGLSPNFMDTPRPAVDRVHYVALEPEQILSIRDRVHVEQSRTVSQKAAYGDRRVRLVSADELGRFATIRLLYEGQPTGDMITVHAEAVVLHSVALRLGDDSMGPRFPGGSVVVISDLRSPRPEDFVVTVLPGTARAVLRQWADAGGRQFFIPLNRAYPAVEATSGCRVLGVVVEAIALF